MQARHVAGYGRGRQISRLVIIAVLADLAADCTAHAGPPRPVGVRPARRPADTRAVLTSRAAPPALTAPPPAQVRYGVPSPAARRATGRLRARLYRVFHEAGPLTSGDARPDGEDGHRQVPAGQEQPAPPPTRT
jgi:hypothetical protein